MLKNHASIRPGHEILVIHDTYLSLHNIYYTHWQDSKKILSNLLVRIYCLKFV